MLHTDRARFRRNRGWTVSKVASPISEVTPPTECDLLFGRALVVRRDTAPSILRRHDLPAGRVSLTRGIRGDEAHSRLMPVQRASLRQLRHAFSCERVGDRAEGCARGETFAERSRRRPPLRPAAAGDPRAFTPRATPVRTASAQMSPAPARRPHLHDDRTVPRHQPTTAPALPGRARQHAPSAYLCLAPVRALAEPFGPHTTRFAPARGRSRP